MKINGKVSGYSNSYYIKSVRVRKVPDEDNKGEVKKIFATLRDVYGGPEHDVIMELDFSEVEKLLCSRAREE